MHIKSLLFTGVFLFLLHSSYAQVQHVEPLNWWVGMKDPALQVMIHGEGVGETVPSINYPGVRIVKTNKADSKNYLFLDLVISPNTKPGALTIECKKDGRSVYKIPYQLLQRDANASKLKGFDASDVIYLITPDRFVNGDTANDVIPGMKEQVIDRSKVGARHGGDIRGIINNLDYISSMGFTAIWPQPMVENDMPAYSYHGYAITNHYKVDPRFGSLDEYKELSAKARAKGMKLIYDGVINHSGTGYWWMKDLPFRDWLNYADTPRITNHRRTTNEDRYASQYDKDLMTKGWFDVTMADMNGANPFMANYLIQNSIWWIETLKLGGLRQDTYCYSDKTLLQNWSCRIMNEYPEFNMVGEEWSLNPTITSYWQQGKKNIDGYTSCLKTTMDFPLQAALVQALKEKEQKYTSTGLTRLYEALANDFVYPDPTHIMVFGDNHDMDRIYTQLGEDLPLTKMAVTYLLTTRGIPQFYYGTEILMSNTGHLNDHGVIRTDFPGGWKNDAVDAVSGKGLSKDQAEMQNYLKRLLAWRKQNKVIANGKTLHFAPFDGMYIFFRYDKENTLMIVLNKNDKEMALDTKRFAEIIKGKSRAVEVLEGREQDISKEIRIPARSTAVYKIQ